MISLSRTILALTLQLAVCTPALAQYIDEAAFEELTDLGIAAYEQAQQAVRRDDWSTACTQFTRAANLWSQANADAPAEAESANLNSTTMAREAANIACKAANGTTPFSRTDARTDAAFNAQVRDLRKGNNWAAEQYRFAESYYEEGNYTAACSNARLAADELDRIVRAMRANPELEGAFGNPAQVYQNAKIVAEARDETFCNKVTGAQRNSLEQDALQGAAKAKEAKRLYEAGDFPGSCAAARLSVDAYARMTSALRSDTALRSAFDDPEAVFENAKVITDYRDRYYCAKPG